MMAEHELADRCAERTFRRISAPTRGWILTRSNSSGVSASGFDRMCSGTAMLPMSCSSAAVRTA